jgi:hypothetical protein
MQCKYFSITALVLLSWMSCGDGTAPQDTDTSSPYYVDDASYLYFKNLRVKDYTVEERQTPRVDVYRHRDGAEIADRPTMRIALIDNWLQDEAYLQIELVDAAGASLGPVSLSPRFGGATAGESYVVGSGQPADALAFVRAVRAAANQRRVLTFAAEGGGVADFVIDLNDFSPQLTTIDDYLRLIDG